MAKAGRSSGGRSRSGGGRSRSGGSSRRSGGGSFRRSSFGSFGRSSSRSGGGFFGGRSGASSGNDSSDARYPHRRWNARRSWSGGDGAGGGMRGTRWIGTAITVCIIVVLAFIWFSSMR